MALNPMKWKIKSFIYFFIVLIFYCLVVYKKEHRVTYETKITNVNPEKVWEFVADFGNMKKLNPTIEDFEVLTETGNFDHWEYSVKYTEHLSQTPSVKNTIYGHFIVKPVDKHYLIKSKHTTCFIGDYFGCVNSLSEFKFIKEQDHTKCEEIVQYECPIVFSSFCYKEVIYQRQEISKNLQNHFKH